MSTPQTVPVADYVNAPCADKVSAKRRVGGRRRKEHSRAEEFRRRLTLWQQIPESSRPSLRVLASELKTSHQLLSHYLAGLAKWQANEYWRRAKGILAQAQADGRTMTPWEEQQYRALDRRAVCLFIEGSFENSVKTYEREIEGCIKDGEMPNPAYSKLLRVIASTPKGAAPHRGAQRARAILQKYFSPEAQEALRKQLRKAGRAKRAVPKLTKAQYHEIRLQKLVQRFEEIDGVLLLDDGQVCHFIPEESALSRALVSELRNYSGELKRILELNPGKVDFGRVKAEICHRFPAVPLTPLNPH